LGGNALRVERPVPGLGDERGKVLRWSLIANGTVRLATDEGEIGNVIGFPSCLGALEDGLREDVVELKAMLCPGMVEGDREV
jgi:hypothetical protein